jgi:glutathione S-transferase
MLEELGLDYELIEIDHRADETKTEAYAAINPNQHIPTLVDGDFVLWESMAINLYLADKHDGGLKPKSVEAAGKTYQWTFWGMMETEHLFLTALRHRWMYPEQHRKPQRADEAEAALQKPLRILNDALAGRSYLVAEAFTVADLNLAALVAWGRRAEVSLSAYANIEPWLEACLSRPAWGRVQAKSPPPGPRQFKPGWDYV